MSRTGRRPSLSLSGPVINEATSVPTEYPTIKMEAAVPWFIFD
eukprot:CAMPEP_0185924780 /NCGR_PEP_ID=MMETSP0924C-20121207/12891_1 /TAXON_ID=321610 /ORGANISM="Perkinsus chesapeaki, Strain ATCC PRA-65" /LENGTH=42 /DNA_ID= /DNA_START= /DNA_END= /DNA_ORIENTATION=